MCLYASHSDRYVVMYFWFLICVYPAMDKILKIFLCVHLSTKYSFQWDVCFVFCWFLNWITFILTVENWRLLCIPFINPILVWTYVYSYAIWEYVYSAYSLSFHLINRDPYKRKILDFEWVVNLSVFLLIVLLLPNLRNIYLVFESKGFSYAPGILVFPGKLFWFWRYLINVQ